MFNRGSTLIGIVLIVLFLGGLVLFSYRTPVPSNAADFAAGTNQTFPTFPVKNKLKAISNVPVKGTSVSLEELFGDRQTLLVNFWATWCPPCLEELPSVEYLARQLNSADNKNYPLLVTISVDEEAAEIPKLFKTLDFSPSLIVLHDPEGELSQSMGTTRFPETYLIDKQGKVLRKWIGPQNWLSGGILQSLAFNSLH